MNKPIKEAATMDIPKLDKKPRDFMSWRLSLAIINCIQNTPEVKPTLDNIGFSECQPLSMVIKTYDKFSR